MLDLLYELTPKQMLVLNIIDAFVVLIFIIDLIVEYNDLKNKKKFLKYYWLDVFAVLPFLTAFRVLKIAKVLRVVKIIKAEKIFKIDGVLKLRHIFHLRKIKILHRATSTTAKKVKIGNKVYRL